ncbi:MAG: D-alanyl-D-alanine carboxypeptidase [Saccharofermentans sp.]|nr:D-alanyl-D-alanine carboxypeptidase [Saccharofermentans sp.]
MKKIIATFLTIILAVGMIFPGAVLAVNEQFDNPDDNLISQNEAVEDLMDEVPPGAPTPTGTSYILMDANSGSILMGKGIDQTIEPAAISKIMTVLLAIENLEMDDVITVTASMYAFLPEEYSGDASLGMTEGEQFTVKDLIYSILLTSGNDACLALAITIAGNEASFCSLMNQRAAELGCQNTTFTSCYGASSYLNTSTARDLALILAECTNHQEFTDISRTYQHTISATNLYDASRILSNGSRFISTQEYAYEYYIGGKTGYSENVGYTIAAASEKNGRKLIAVILGATNSENRYRDVIDLFEFGFSSYTTIQLEPSEFTPLYNDTLEQINGVLLNTELGVIDSSMEFSSYLTTTSARTSLGSTNMIELKDVVIDTTLDDQYFNIPICKAYNDGKIYIVGVLHLHIAIKDKVIEKTPEKHSVWSNLRTALIAIIVIIALLLILVYAFYLFIKKNRRRSENDFRNRNKML